MTTPSNCFTSIQTVSVPSSRCLLCPSMDLIVVASDRLLVQRTLSWQRVATSEKDCSALCWSPDGTLLALGLKNGGYVIYNLEMGMTDEEENCVHQQLGKSQVESLVWTHVGRPHKGWILTDEEKERELEWSYRSAYLDRSSAFLPPSTYIQGDGEREEAVRKSNPFCTKPLSLLCAATSNDGVHLYVHGRFPIGNLDCTTPQQIVCSSDLAYLSVLESPSKVSIYSTPGLVKHRFSLQTISALYSSIQSHLQAIREGAPSVLSSVRNTLKPLDIKLDSLQKILTNYGIESSMNSVLMQHIILGKLSKDANAMEQFFSGVQMNDQLLIRMEKTLHNGLSAVETLARAALLGPARSLVFDVYELFSLDDELLPNTKDLINKTRALLLSVEYLLSQIVEARFRLRDFCAWMRSEASQVKAKGTAPDSVQSENAKKRRVPQHLLNRVSDYFQQEALLEEGLSSTETVLRCCISTLISGRNSHVRPPSAQTNSPQSVKMPLFEPEGIRTVMSALEQAQEGCAKSFEQPRTFIQGGILKTEIRLPVKGVSSGVIQPRMGIEASPGDDKALLEGAFFPLTSSDDESFSCSRQWTVLALTRTLTNGQHGIHLILVPLEPGKSFVLSRYLGIPDGFIVKEVGFYGDDGKSNLFSGEESGNCEEVRQAIGLLVEKRSDLALWLIPYDQVRFDVFPASQNRALIDICDLDIPISSVVQVHQKSNESEGDENSHLVYARTRCVHTNSEETVESRLLLCGSRGVGGVVTCNENRVYTLSLFDLEEDEEHDEESEGESMQD